MEAAPFGLALSIDEQVERLSHILELLRVGGKKLRELKVAGLILTAKTVEVNDSAQNQTPLLLVLSGGQEHLKVVRYELVDLGQSLKEHKVSISDPQRVLEPLEVMRERSRRE